MPQFSGAERSRNNVPRFRPVIDVTAATRAMTTDESGALVLLNRSGGIDITLPALLSADDIGTTYEFVSVLAASSDTYTITAQAADLLIGRALLQDTDTSNTITSFAPDGSDDLIVTFSDTADLPGGTIVVTAISASRWLVQGTLFHTGNSATPFS